MDLSACSKIEVEPTLYLATNQKKTVKMIEKQQQQIPLFNCFIWNFAEIHMFVFGLGEWIRAE